MDIHLLSSEVTLSTTSQLLSGWLPTIHCSHHRKMISPLKTHVPGLYTQPDLLWGSTFLILLVKGIVTKKEMHRLWHLRQMRGKSQACHFNYKPHEQCLRYKDLLTLKRSLCTVSHTLLLSLNKE